MESFEEEIRGVNMQGEFIYDDIVTDKRVLCGTSALNRAGLISASSNHLYLMTTWEEFDNLDLAYAHFVYYPKVDYKHWVSPSKSNPLILQPTKERAIVEYILNEKWCDEGLLIEALKSYISFFWNEKELYKVADFFGLKRDVLDYWIKEAKEDEEV